MLDFIYYNIYPFIENWKINFFKNNLPFCEYPYSFNSYVPQLASASAHFPYLPIILLSISYHDPSIINNNIQNYNVRFFLKLQTSLQLVSMIGHIIPNPRSLLIQEISIILMINWIYNFCKLTTYKKDMPTNKIIFFSTIIVVNSMYIIGLQITINILVIILGFFFIRGYKIMNKLSNNTCKLISSSFLSSFLILALEDIYCDNLLTFSRDFPWHLIFDIIFWQVFTSLIDIIILSNNKKWFHETNSIKD